VLLVKMRCQFIHVQFIRWDRGGDAALATAPMGLNVLGEALTWGTVQICDAEDVSGTAHSIAISADAYRQLTLADGRNGSCDGHGGADDASEDD
jgi:hypothetical protein